MILLEGNGTIMFMCNFYSDMVEKKFDFLTQCYKIFQRNSLNYRSLVPFYHKKYINLNWIFLSEIITKCYMLTSGKKHVECGVNKFNYDK